MRHWASIRLDLQAPQIVPAEMTNEAIRASEDELLVFISSRQDEEMAQARDAAIKAVDNYPGMRVWAFEDAPASSEAARHRYIRNASKADLVIWLIGSTTSLPVAEEVDACLSAGCSLLPFKMPAQVRDSHTTELLGRIRDLVTWRNVENVDLLCEHIRQALTDEIVRRFKGSHPVSHDQILAQRQRESIAETKRLWTTLGVRDAIAQELADDRTIGQRIDLPASGVLQVIAGQGSGKTLAAHRLYQQTLDSRINSRLEPLPVFLNARSIDGELKDHIEASVGDQGFIYSQRILVIIDGLDEAGRYQANKITGDAIAFTEANQNVAAVVLTRALPGLKQLDASTSLAECSESEFLAIASRVAERPILARDVLYRLSLARIPLFAVIVGTHFRETSVPLGPSPSQVVDQLVRRLMENSESYPEEMAEPLKKLAVACIDSGDYVSKATVDARASVQAQLADSRLVVERAGKVDFGLALFREWFAARALVEGAKQPSDTDLTSDRWVVPLAIAINSDDGALGFELMEVISTRDPGIAALVLHELRRNWSMEDLSGTLPDGSAIEIGGQIHRAMSNWRDGLGPLMPEISAIPESGDIPTLAVDKGPRMVTTMWYSGQAQMDSVVEIPPGLNPFSYDHTRDWNSMYSTVIDQERVWPWNITKKQLSSSLSDVLRSYRFALGTTVGTLEFAGEFVETIRYFLPSRARWPRINEITSWIDQWIDDPRIEAHASISIGGHMYTVSDLQLIRSVLPKLPRSEVDRIQGPWPGPDKPWPAGRTSVVWHELYSERQLLKRTQAIFSGALVIYNNIVEQWFGAFNRRSQMRFMFPIRLEGILSLQESLDRPDWSDATLTWWPRHVMNGEESGVFLELGAKQVDVEIETRKRLRTAQEESWARGEAFRHTVQIIPGNDPRPATALAHKWITSDLRDLRWI